MEPGKNQGDGGEKEDASNATNDPRQPLDCPFPLHGGSYSA